MAMIQATMELVQARDHQRQVMARIQATRVLVQARVYQRQVMARIQATTELVQARDHQRPDGKTSLPTSRPRWVPGMTQEDLQKTTQCGTIMRSLIC